MLDLHNHTTCSDGTLSPTALVQSALDCGIQVLGITDHDTVAGWQEAQQAARGQNLEIVPGLELSTTANGKSVHILGFYPDLEKIRPFLQERLLGRRRRAIAMVEKLRSLGYPIRLPELETESPDAAPGRPHLAAALVKAGHVQSHQEAFDRFLKDGGPAYVAYEPLSTVDGIQQLRRCGAVPVWAHPYLWKGGSIAKTLPEWVAAGLMGLEVYHPSHMPHQREALLALCQQYDLLITGGSDYHGPRLESKSPLASSSQPERQLNCFALPATLLAPLKAAAKQSSAAQ